MIREAYSLTQPPLKGVVYTYNERLYIRPFLVPWIPYGAYSRSLGGGSGSGNLTYLAGLARLLKRANNFEAILMRIIRH